MKKMITIVLILAVALLADYHHALDLKGGWLWNPSVDSLQGSLGVKGFYNSIGMFENGLYIPTDMRLFTYTLPAADERMGTPLEKYTSPNSFTAYTGLGWKGFMDLRMRGYVRMNSGNSDLVMPWSPSQEVEYLSGRFKEKNHVGFDFNVIVPHERFNIQLYSLNLFANQNYTNDLKPELNSENQKDHDWWSTVDGSFNIIDKKLMLVGEFLHKNDLADHGAYDLTFGKIGLGSELKIGKKWRIWGDISGQIHDNRRMVEKGYLNEGEWTKNIGVSSDIRSFIALKKRLYIKGDIQTDLSDRMKRIRYDMAIRKVWKKQRISSQIGYWSTPGALFPQNCSYYGGSFGIGKRVDILPQAKLYWMWDKKEENYTYNHTDLNLEVNVNLPEKSAPFFTRLTILGGVDCKLFDDETLFFSDQLSAYFGVRTQL